MRRPHPRLTDRLGVALATMLADLIFVAVVGVALVAVLALTQGIEPWREALSYASAIVSRS